MVTSTFELLVKRIATVPPTIPPNISTVFRRVVQGFFMNITNLSDSTTSNLFLRITIPLSSGNRIINNTNTQCFFDNGNVNNAQLSINSGTPNATSIVYTTSSFRLGARQTGLITLLPNVIPFINLTNPDLEIRGYIEVLTSRFNGQFFTLGAIPASEVLISPEIRGTFLDNDYPATSPSNELDFDQIAYGLPTASGRAQNTVAGLPPIIFSTDDFQQIELPSFLKANPGLEETEAGQILEMVKGIRVKGKK